MAAIYDTEAYSSESLSSTPTERGVYNKPLCRTLTPMQGADYETAILKAGFGKFHWWLLWVCGWVNASDAIEILCISFVLPSATCDLDLTSAQKGWLTAITFIGLLIGGYAWGCMGDFYGRRNTLLVSMSINTFFGAVSSLSQTSWQFFVFRFLSGVGVGGSIPLIWSYFAEFQSKNNRGRMLSALATFWMIGNIAVAGVACVILPYDIGLNPLDNNKFKYNSWRIFILFCAIPSLLVTVGLSTLPDSPKFLLAQGRDSEALTVLRKIYAKNTGSQPSEYPICDVKDNYEEDNKSNNPIQMIRNTVVLFRRPLLWVTINVLFINFAIQFGYYGLWIWFPELFNKLDIYYRDNPDAGKVGVCEITSYQSEDPVSVDCSPPTSSVFLDSFLISISALPGDIWSISHMDKLGRNFFLVFSMVLSGACVFLIYMVKSKQANLAISCVFGLVSCMGFNAMDCMAVELFPTSVRSTAMAVSLAVARLGAIFGTLIFGYFIDLSCAIPILLVAGLLVTGGLVGLVLPKTHREPLA